MRIYTKETNRKIQCNKGDETCDDCDCNKEVVKYIETVAPPAPPTCPGIAIPLQSIAPDEINSIKGLNVIGLNEINPHCGHGSSGCFGEDTLTINGDLRVSENLKVFSHTMLHDVSCNWHQYFNNSHFFTWGVHIIPKSGTIFTLGMKGLHTNVHHHVHWDHQSETVRGGGGTGWGVDGKTPYSASNSGKKGLLGTNPNTQWEGFIGQPCTAWTTLDAVTTGAHAQYTFPGTISAVEVPTNDYDNNAVGTGAGSWTDFPPTDGTTPNENIKCSHWHSVCNSCTACTPNTPTTPCSGGSYSGVTTCNGGSVGQPCSGCTACTEVQYSKDCGDHRHRHRTNQDKCQGTHDHHILDETRVWYQGWLYPGFGGYGTAAKSGGTANDVGGNDQECTWNWPSATDHLNEDNIPNIEWNETSLLGGSKGTDFDASHNQWVYGGAVGALDDFTITGKDCDGVSKTHSGTSGANGGGFAYRGPHNGLSITGEYTGCCLTQQPRLGGWSDRSSFPTCGFEAPNLASNPDRQNDGHGHGGDWPYAYAVAHSVPFDGWIICDTSGSPFHTNAIWPHNHIIRKCLDKHLHHHDDGTGPADGAEFPSPAIPAKPGKPHDIYDGIDCSQCTVSTCSNYETQQHHHSGPSSRFSWMLGKYDGDCTNNFGKINTAQKFVLTLEFYLVKCKSGCECCEGQNPAKPELIGTATIKTRCGSAKWGDGNIFALTNSAQKNGNTISIKAGDAIGIFIKSNNYDDGSTVGGTTPTNALGRLHSPSTFSLEVHRKY